MNLLWSDGGRIGAVLDWDRLSVRPLAAEVVRSATLMFGHGDERGLDLDRVAAFAGGYRSRHPLPARALADAEHRLWWNRVCDLWQLDRHHGGDAVDTSCDHLFVSSSALVVWWSGHRDEVRSALTAGC